MSFLDSWTTDDLDFLADDLDDGSDDGLQGLTRAISGQYVEVVASFLRASFVGQDDLPLLEAQLRPALSALRRLASATGDTELHQALDALLTLVPEAHHLGGRPRERYLREAREWLLAFAGLLRHDDAVRLMALVSFDDRSEPLLHRLLQVYGIGPRRLERLYCAGLFSVETLVSASPEEVAQVTGMTPLLARSVIHAAKEFDRRRRMVAARALLDRTRDAVALLQEAARHGRTDPGLLHAMRTARLELDQAMGGVAVHPAIHEH